MYGPISGRGDPSAITVASFPCITTSSQSVDFDFGSGELPNLEEVRFANWVTGPAGEFGFEDFGGQSSLTSIYAPRLTGTQSLDIFIGGNPNLAEVDLCALKEAESVEVRLTLTFVYKNILYRYGSTAKYIRDHA
ncbi:hypothetical protein NFJ02_13g15430 [Pycnococcus provasolii]